MDGSRHTGFDRTTKTISAIATNSATTQALRSPSINSVSYGAAQLLCDWTLSVSDCRDEKFTRVALLVSAIAHALVAVFGMFVLRLHNGGFRRTMVTDIFRKTGWTIDAKRPLDCFILFSISACFFRVLAVVVLLLDHPQPLIWLRIALDQLYWASFIVAVLPYLLGTLSSIPVTDCEGVFAVYRPEPGLDGVSQPAIYLFYPTMRQKTQFLLCGSTYPIVFGVGCGVASGVLNERAFYGASRTLHIIQHFSWALLFWLLMCCNLYYGIKYTTILRRSNKSILKITRTVALGFGFFAFEMKATAGLLIAMWQITTYGGSFAFFVAGALSCLWAWNREAVLSAKDVRGTRTMEVLWTCGIGLTLLIKLTLIALHSYLTADVESQRPLNDAPSRSVSSDVSDYHRNNLDSPLEQNIAMDVTQETTWADRAVLTCCSVFCPGSSKDMATKSSNCKDAHVEGGERRKAGVEERHDLAADFSTASSLTAITITPRIRDAKYDGPAATSDGGSPSVALDPVRQASEVQAILLRYQSALRQIQWLQILHQQERHPQNKREQFEELQYRMQEIKLQVQKVQVLAEKYQQSQTQLQTGDTLGLIGSMRDYCLQSDLLALQHQVKSSLQQFSILANSHSSSLRMP